LSRQNLSFHKPKYKAHIAANNAALTGKSEPRRKICPHAFRADALKFLKFTLKGLSSNENSAGVKHMAGPLHHLLFLFANNLWVKLFHTIRTNRVGKLSQGMI
jgi:hypothetical protein